MDGKTTVVHCKREAYDVYIGRPSKWGNPFEIGVDGSRDEVVAKYRAWVLQQPELLASLSELKGKRIACWCAPRACHGHVLAELADGEITMDQAIEDDRELLEYPVRICVAGSRSFHNREKFDYALELYLTWAGKKPHAFISGDAWRGPDRMIIDWAKEHGKPCFKFAADWDTRGKAAGHIRNGEMRRVLTHLLVFWDGVSRGTKEMIENTMKLEGIHIFVVLVEPDPEWIERQQKKKS